MSATASAVPPITLWQGAGCAPFVSLRARGAATAGSEGARNGRDGTGGAARGGQPVDGHPP